MRKGNRICIGIVLCLMMTGCSTILKNGIEWNTICFTKVNEGYLPSIDWSKVKVGDILIQETDGTSLGWFGHSSIVVAVNAVAEIPKLGETVYYRDIDDWKHMRRVAVFRYKNITDDFRKTLFDVVKKTIGKPYLIIDKNSDRGFYCSSFIWYIFNRTAKIYGKNLDLDSNGGIFCMPWDIMLSDELELVDMMK